MAAPLSTQHSALSTLTRLSVPDFVDGFGVPANWRGRGVLEALFAPLARRFAALAAAYDEQVGAVGLPTGSEWLLRRTVAGVEVAGGARVPGAGPLLVVSNHPGLADAPALFATLGRRDLRVVVADRPFLRALPHLARHVIYVSPGDGGRRETVRAVVAHLRAGGAVLTFPAGRIEPDPAVLPGAAAALADWSPSVGLFLRLAPDTVVVPAVVSGVLSPRALANPLTRVRRQRRDREWLAALLQILVPTYQGVRVRVALGEPRTLQGLLAVSGRRGAAVAARAIVAEVARLVSTPPAAWQPLWRADAPAVPGWAPCPEARVTAAGGLGRDLGQP